MAKEEKCGSKRSRRVRGRDKAKPQTKVVIRHLPPTMTEEEFLKQIDPLPEHDFYYFSEADWSLGYDATCKAYITCKNPEDVFLFHERFDGYVFVDNKGNEYAAIVEFAPFQGFLKNKSRNTDNKVNTIEQEPLYQQFLKRLEDEREAAAKGGETKLEFSLDAKKEEVTSTPLLQFLANKREKRRDDNKKRSAEKKRRREEDKEKRKQNHAQPVKLLTNSELKNQQAEKSEQKNNQNKEEPKNARIRRREQRNRQRHEAYLQRKQASQSLSSENSPNSQTVKDEDEEQQNGENETKSDTTNKPIEILKNTKTDELTESVRIFILTAATNISTPTTEDKIEEASDVENKNKSTDDLTKVEEKLSTMEISNKNHTNEEEQKQEQANEPEEQENEPEEQENEPKEQEKQENINQKQIDEKREERRIRNKDRPSIAIYQPKARLRLSEESDSNSASKDVVGSKSASDGEAVKKDEMPRLKKVQRYSERSKNRKANKEPSKEVETKPDNEQ